MIQIHTTTAVNLPGYAAEQCAGELCWDNSESQSLFRRICAGELTDRERGWMVGYAVIEPEHWDDEDYRVVGWVSVTEWVVGDEERLQVQGYVRHDMRKQGIASALVACVCHRMPTTNLPVAVFSPEFLRIAKRRGWNATQYKSVDDGWIAVASTQTPDTGAGPDSAGVHADAPEVRGVPLAGGTEGPSP
jgi:GNAT superfamily N-acetyltransferase